MEVLPFLNQNKQRFLDELFGWLRILSVDSRRREAPFRGYKAVDVVGMSNP